MTLKVDGKMKEGLFEYLLHAISVTEMFLYERKRNIFENTQKK